MEKIRSYYCNPGIKEKIIEKYCGKCENCSSKTMFKWSGFMEKITDSFFIHSLFRFCNKCNSVHEFTLKETPETKNSATIMIHDKNQFRGVVNVNEMPIDNCLFCGETADKLIQVGPFNQNLVFYQCGNCTAQWEGK